MRKITASEEIVLAILLALLIAGFFILIAYSHPTSLPRLRALIYPRPDTSALDGTAEFDPKPPLRLSVIKGGVKSLDDLREHIQHDPTLAAFLSAHGFEIDTAKFQLLGKDQDVLVSYRPNHGSIIWTKHKVHLTADEIVIVDGNGIMILAECGNMIEPAPTPSPEPDLVFSQVTPPLFDIPPTFTPTFETTDITTPELTLPPGEEIPPSTIVPLVPTTYPPTGFYPIFGVPCCGAPIVPPIGPPVITPEPATIWLFLGGIVLVWIAIWRLE
jgi:hypothetical protein